MEGCRGVGASTPGWRCLAIKASHDIWLCGLAPDEPWRAVVLNLWRNVCPSCFDDGCPRLGFALRSRFVDIFAVQDEITAAIATAIAPAIINAEQQRVLAKSPERLDAWEANHSGIKHGRKDYAPRIRQVARRIRTVRFLVQRFSGKKYC